MTREEAIKQLDTMWKMLTSAYDDIADSHVEAYTMAVDALKAQGTCEDAVSRQTLQKELALYPIDDVTSEDEAGYNRAINDVQKMVLHLPSTQPQSTMGQVNDTAQSTNDCISRQAAIELIERMKPYHQEADDIAEMIANMPSAQTELTQNLHNACTDLISRQEVIKLLDEAWVDGHEYQGWLHDEVNRLPPAQPKPCEDAVSRADAFNAINDYVNTVGVLDGYADTQEVLRIVKRLPSAQPEIIRCRDCKKCQIDSIYHDYWCDGRKVWKDHYCGYAERKE